jgi:hypothetical protein
MSRTSNGALVMVLLVVLSACSTNRRAAETPANNQSSEATKWVEATAAEATRLAESTKLAESTPPAETMTPVQEGGALSVGQASGSYTSKGETVELKYAYAGRGKRFGQEHESIIVLVTDRPIPPEAVAAEIKSPDMLYDEKIRGLEYVVEPNNESYWVCFYPIQYQETKAGSNLKAFSVAQETVTGHDENDRDVSDGKYKCSVRFVAAIVK